ncbi:hypothetical protein WJX75_006179 [Coccomyxa subellipsoidea]|uniref:Uncharacterized protein n=1 Tax=Coccomyxa subellipsoidea TaxID=248742 RepID=A0ABR2Z3M5_9CHLO
MAMACPPVEYQPALPASIIAMAKKT